MIEWLGSLPSVWKALSALGAVAVVSAGVGATAASYVVETPGRVAALEAADSALAETQHGIIDRLDRIEGLVDLNLCLTQAELLGEPWQGCMR